MAYPPTVPSASSTMAILRRMVASLHPAAVGAAEPAEPRLEQIGHLGALLLVEGAVDLRERVDRRLAHRLGGRFDLRDRLADARLVEHLAPERLRHAGTRLLHLVLRLLRRRLQLVDRAGDDLLLLRRGVEPLEQTMEHPHRA